ncbi:MAG: hypothetical protein AAF244_03355 [Pseudomonadota bacterium]
MTSILIAFKAENGNTLYQDETRTDDPFYLEDTLKSDLSRIWHARDKLTDAENGDKVDIEDFDRVEVTVGRETKTISRTEFGLPALGG